MPSPEKNIFASEAGAFADDSFAPLAVLEESLHFWWFLFLLIVAGGLVGWFIHQARPPVYEAIGEFSASIDFVSTGPLSQFEEDVALNTISNLVNSTAMVRSVSAQAREEGIDITARELRRSSIMERRLDTWQLRVRNIDPQAAERLANIWVEQGRALLLESYRNALEAEEMHRLLLSLESCLEQAVVVEPAGGQCTPDRFADIQADMSAAGKLYSEAKLGSGGLSSSLVLGPAEYIGVSSQPVILARNQVVLAGCLLGLLAGILLLQFRVPSRWMKRS